MECACIVEPSCLTAFSPSFRTAAANSDLRSAIESCALELDEPTRKHDEIECQSSSVGIGGDGGTHFFQKAGKLVLGDEIQSCPYSEPNRGREYIKMNRHAVSEDAREETVLGFSTRFKGNLGCSEMGAWRNMGDYGLWIVYCSLLEDTFNRVPYPANHYRCMPLRFRQKWHLDGASHNAGSRTCSQELLPNLAQLTQRHFTSLSTFISNRRHRRLGALSLLVSSLFLASLLLNFMLP
ncbi:uncharacterized protein BDR25DRAFT_349572 [Lindgomyces ingoldianus]|uniref:Uncharacterized protein n=1 Tax=Lindgomyces ingoldianus TaxID=673940 RepID=A0ACB6RCM6_9PLEO|nr:uncharacterized protein BDR25DRAFT_349572 [Lindgomyces ingoldianus]KAF2476485.1 hypothetical protein BDR25DRAFT_349572 [Lindgomyces ingoldianus]